MMRLLLPCFVLGACSPVAPTPTPRDERAPSSARSWIKARAAADARALEAPAQVVPGPGAVAAITPPLPARLVRFRAQLGDSVAKDAPIVDVLMPEAVAAAGRLSAARTRSAALSERQRALESLARDGLARTMDRIEVDGQLADARAEAQLALATLAAAGLRAEEAEALLTAGGRVALRAPFAGVVTELDGEIGEQRSAGAKPFARIVDTRALRIEARFTQALAAGGRAVFVDASGVARDVAWASKALVSDGGGFRAVFALPAEGAWLPGTFGRVRLTPAARWVVVPATSVGPSGEVLRRNGEREAVQIVVRSGAEAVIAAPRLVPGDEIAETFEEHAP